MADVKNNEILTRIQLKYDSYSEWTSKNPTLLPGEVAIAKLVNDVTIQPEAQKNAPVLFKVGPGAFNSLPWVSGLAADVYAWAKQETLPVVRAENDGTEGNVISSIKFENNKVVYTTASVATSEGMENLQKEINDNRDAWALDTDTQYFFSNDGDKLVVKKALYTNGVKGDEVAVGTYEFLSETEVRTILADYYTKSEVDGLIAGIDTGVHSVALAGGTNNGTLKLTVDGNSTDNIAVTGLGDAAYTTVAELNATAKDYAEAVEAKFGDLATKDTITENDISGTIGANKITNFATEVAGVKVAEATTADKVGHKLTVGDKKFDGSDDVVITAADLGLSNALHFVGTTYPATPVAGDVVLDGTKEYVYDGSKWVELGDGDSHALKTAKIIADNGLKIMEGGTLAGDTRIGIDDLGVTTAKIADKAVTTAKIADGAVTADKLADDAKKLISDVDDKVAKINASLARDTGDDICFSFTDATGKRDETYVQAGEELNLDASTSGYIVIDHDKHEFTAPTTGDYVSGITVNEYGHVTGYTKASLPEVPEHKSANDLLTINTDTDGKITFTVKDQVADLGYADDESWGAGAYKVVTTISQSNGQVGQIKQTIADVAVTGDVKDLKQTAGTYIVFNCGTASTVI